MFSFLHRIVDNSIDTPPEPKEISEQEVIDALNMNRASFCYDDHDTSFYVPPRFSDEVFEFLLNQLATNNVTTHLAFDPDILNENQIVQLAQLLTTNETLQSLDLRNGVYCSSMEIFPIATQAIAKTLKVNQCLNEVVIPCCNEGALTIAEALETNTSLLKLDLSGSKIGNTGAEALAKALKVNSSLQSLDLSHTKIGDEGAEALAKALEENKSLQTLNLSGNKIGSTGAIALAGALGVNSSLQELNLEFNDITEAVLPRFCYALEVNETLETLEIYNKNIKPYVHADYLRSSDCKYRPPGSSIKKAYPKSHAENVSPSTEEKQKDGGDNHKLEGNPSSGEQPADDSLFSLSTPQEALPPAGTPDETAPLEPMGESSALYGGFCSIS